jgi:Ser/Thr protein kinase RdoA (MazF antagonist)
MAKKFSELSYLGQVRTLRKVAEEVVKNYPLKVQKLKFINHGENATFAVMDSKKQYLLRLHRSNYHSLNAIKEELNWLKKINAQKKIAVQTPIKSSFGKLVHKQTFGQHGEFKYCDLLEWKIGKMRYNKLSSKDFYKVGTLAANLHQSSSVITSVHRNYWDAGGLIGNNATFGPLKDMSDYLGVDFAVVNRVRKSCFQRLKKYEDKNPQRSSLIHADLHFGNLIWNKNGVVPIDFDDCGKGSHLYDLAVTIFSSSQVFKKLSKKERINRLDSFFEGYSTLINLDEKDIKMIDYYLLARKLTMLGWLYHRRDNPVLFNHLKKTKIDRIKFFRKVLKNGPDSIFK